MRQQQDLQLVVEPGDGRLELIDLGPHGVAVLALGLGQHLLGSVEVVEGLAIGPVDVDDVLELLVLARQVPEARLIRGHVGLAEQGEGVLVLCLSISARRSSKWASVPMRAMFSVDERSVPVGRP